MTLEDYLAQEYEANRADISALEEALRRASRTFVRAFRTLDGTKGRLGYWDYELRPAGPLRKRSSKDISQGTVAMVLAALWKLTRHEPRLTGPEGPFLGNDKELAKLWDQGAEALVSAIEAQKGVLSGSFGRNDPITLSHIAEVLRGTVGLDRSKKDAVKGIVDRLHRLLKRKYGGASALDNIRNLSLTRPLGDPMFGLDQNEKTYLGNAFVPLRIVRCRRLLEEAGAIEPDDQRLTDFQRLFETTLHQQLSFSSIQDSRFDPAELMFGLEGLVLLAPTAIETHLFVRILDVLETKQKESAHWRPSKPIFATPQGMTMLPISVEGVNSLLRSFEILCYHRHDEFAAFGTRCVAMVRRFWQWLHTRMVVSAEYSGWHSEHVNDRDLVHTWDTSQVVEFMLGYRFLLGQDIAHRTLTLSRVKVRKPQPSMDWPDVIKEREATTKLGDDYRTYRRLGKEFITPRGKAGGEKSYSALLYGPPGTGKTSLAEKLADALQWPLLSLSVSDFLGDGGTMVEARAKAIFRMLEAQRNCVIFFDEIDSFLLDRNSQHYRDQDTLFQFLTPGMLTKINDLRKLKRSIFLIAANYENRIDPAIKRPGRIDQKYLLLPPDKTKRAAILAELVGAALAKNPSIMQASLFMGYSEIEGAVERAGGSGANANCLLAALGKVHASTGAAAYGERVFIESTYPFEEAACLYRLATEVKLDKEFDESFENAAEWAHANAGDRHSDKKKDEILTKIRERAAQIGRAKE